MKLAAYHEKGFSLLELVIAISIISAALVIIFPKFSFFDDLAIDAEARRLSAFIRRLNEDSSAKKIFYRVRFRTGESLVEAQGFKDGFDFQTPSQQAAFTLSGKTSIEAVDIHAGRAAGDEVTITLGSSFSPPFRVHLKRMDKKRTLIFNPYSGLVKVTEVSG